MWQEGITYIIMRGFPIESITGAPEYTANPPHLQFLAWGICSYLLFTFWDSKTLSIPNHYQQFCSKTRFDNEVAF